MAWWTLYKRELSSYFHSSIAYFVLFSSALVIGIQFVFIVDLVVEQNYREQSVLQIFFTWPLFWLPILVQVPLLTMRVFSEEFKLGTIEMLLTAPVQEWDVVMAKFLGALTFFLILWSPVALDLAALQTFSNPRPPIIWGEIWVTALIFTLMSGFYISMGVFTSAVTKNQIVAAVLSFGLVFTHFGMSLIRWVPQTDSGVLQWISYISTQEHFQNAVRGLFDTRPLVFYFTITFFFLLLTQRLLQARRLKG